MGDLPLDPASPSNLLSWGVGFWAKHALRATLRAGGGDRLDDLLTGQMSISRRTYEARRRLRRRASPATASSAARTSTSATASSSAGYEVVFNPRAISLPVLRRRPRRTTCAGPARRAARTGSWSPSTPSSPSGSRAPPLHHRRSRWLLDTVPARCRRRSAGRCARAPRALVRSGRNTPRLRRLFFAVRTLEYQRGRRAARAQRRRRAPAVVLAYHSLSDLSGDPSSPSTGSTAGDARRAARQLAARGHSFVDLDLLLAALDGRAPLPREGALVTFDDAYADLLPAAARRSSPQRGIPAVVFAVSGQIGGSNEWDRHLGAAELPLLDAEGLRAPDARPGSRSAPTASTIRQLTKLPAETVDSRAARLRRAARGERAAAAAGLRLPPRRVDPGIAKPPRRPATRPPSRSIRRGRGADATASRCRGSRCWPATRPARAAAEAAPPAAGRRALRRPAAATDPDARMNASRCSDSEAARRSAGRHASWRRSSAGERSSRRCGRAPASPRPPAARPATVVTVNWNSWPHLEVLIDVVRRRSPAGTGSSPSTTAPRTARGERIASTAGRRRAAAAGQRRPRAGDGPRRAAGRTEFVVALDVDAFPLHDDWLERAARPALRRRAGLRRAAQPRVRPPLLLGDAEGAVRRARATRSAPTTSPAPRPRRLRRRRRGDLRRRGAEPCTSSRSPASAARATSAPSSATSSTTTSTRPGSTRTAEQTLDGVVAADDSGQRLGRGAAAVRLLSAARRPASEDRVRLAPGDPERSRRTAAARNGKASSRTGSAESLIRSRISWAAAARLR